MLAAIALATDSIRLESYIIADDAIGQRFALALSDAAGRGVHVRVQADAAGSLFEAGKGFFRALETAGISVRMFHRWSWRRPSRYNRRNHYKLLIVDESVLYVGGFNLHAASSARVTGARRWRDTHARITAPAVIRQGITLFEMLWHRRRRSGALDSNPGNPLNLVTNRGFRQKSLLRASFRSAVAGARSRIRITTPYFSPDALTRRHLFAAAARGVEISLLLPGISDQPIPQLAARHIYHRLLGAGMAIHEYRPRMLHAKTMTVDGEWASVGTANFDYRSFFDNHEINLVARSRGICERLDAQFDRDLASAEPINSAHLYQASLAQRLLGPLAWGLRRWL